MCGSVEASGVEHLERAQVRRARLRRVAEAAARVAPAHEPCAGHLLGIARIDRLERAPECRLRDLLLAAPRRYIRQVEQNARVGRPDCHGLFEEARRLVERAHLARVVRGAPQVLHRCRISVGEAKMPSNLCRPARRGRVVERGGEALVQPGTLWVG